MPAGGTLEGVTVAGLRERGIFVLAIVADGDGYAANPPDGRVLTAGESIIVSGSAEALAAARQDTAAARRLSRGATGAQAHA